MQAMENNTLPISETLYIPLAARAAEMTKDNPVLTDRKSAEIINAEDMRSKAIDGGRISTHGILARTIVIDDEIKKMADANPNITVINLGAGLDTRICRVDNGTMRWYDLDLPEVISIRRRFFTENEHIRFISRSVLDTAWVGEINPPEGSNTVIIAEGLLMYFSEKDVSY
jgi:O-methyltransferase involved in polyketide biosynthesis